MVIIPFTRKRNIRQVKDPTLVNKTIQQTCEVMYLGLALDKRMIWKKQLDKAINWAYRTTRTCRSMCWRTWGLKQRVIYRIYTAVVTHHL
jgi:hypothetical protein